MKDLQTDSEIRSKEISGIPNNVLISYQPHISMTTTRMKSDKDVGRSPKSTIYPFEKWGP